MVTSDNATKSASLVRRMVHELVIAEPAIMAQNLQIRTMRVFEAASVFEAVETRWLLNCSM